MRGIVNTFEGGGYSCLLARGQHAIRSRFLAALGMTRRVVSIGSSKWPAASERLCWRATQSLRSRLITLPCPRTRLVGSLMSQMVEARIRNALPTVVPHNRFLRSRLVYGMHSLRSCLIPLPSVAARKQNAILKLPRHCRRRSVRSDHVRRMLAPALHASSRLCLLFPQGFQRIDFRRPARGDITREHRQSGEQ
jgi:hypothetical protein